ncbi:hypothetical protein OQA88_3017 [Cercophora sp. LCS_1]
MAALIPPLLAALALMLAPRPAAAHGGLANYTVGDTWYRGFDPSEPHAEQLGQEWMVQRRWDSIDPIFSVDDPYLACNNPGTGPVNSIPIRAGDTLTGVYWYWLHPVGPMTAWLAFCGAEKDACNGVDVNKLEWFKVWEGGLLEGTLVEGSWYQKAFQKWDGSPALWPVTIPKIVRSGSWMVRHEIVSIHIGGRPQFYPQCAHLWVEGGEGRDVPREYLVKFPGVYTMRDPSISIDIYADEFKDTTNYTIPGGPIWDQ